MTVETAQRAIHVVAGVLIDRQRCVLIAQRPAGKHMAGAWEFPGGKLEPGETPLEGLSRELAEEIGVRIEQPRPLLRLRHRYAYGEVLLDVWVVRRFRGEPRSLDGQALRWCRRSALEGANLLPADRPIIDALRLPERLERRESPHYRLRAATAFRGRLAFRREPCRLEGAICRGSNEARDACAGGADFLVVGNSLEPAALRALCAEVSSPVYARGLSLGRAWALGATGVNALGG